MATFHHKASLGEMARSHTEAALSVLLQVATEGESEAARVSAANALLDRGYGKPTPFLEAAQPTPHVTVEQAQRELLEWMNENSAEALALSEPKEEGEAEAPPE